jgi:hypothetical protein
VTNNRAEAFGGGVFFAGGPLSLSHSIVAANKSTSGLGPDLASLYGEVLSASYSLVGSNAGNPLLEAPIGSPDAGGNLVGGAGFGVIDPLLAPLNYNGGPTTPPWRQALAACPSSTSAARDSRAFLTAITCQGPASTWVLSNSAR